MRAGFRMTETETRNPDACFGFRQMFGCLTPEVTKAARYHSNYTFDLFQYHSVPLAVRNRQWTVVHWLELLRYGQMSFTDPFCYDMSLVPSTQPVIFHFHRAWTQQYVTVLTFH